MKLKIIIIISIFINLLMIFLFINANRQLENKENQEILDNIVNFLVLQNSAVSELKSFSESSLNNLTSESILILRNADLLMSDSASSYLNAKSYIPEALFNFHEDGTRLILKLWHEIGSGEISQQNREELEGYIEKHFKFIDKLNEYILDSTYSKNMEMRKTLSNIYDVTDPEVLKELLEKSTKDIFK